MALTPLVIRDGNNAAASQEMLQGVSGSGNNIPVMSLDSTRVTYRASANFTPVATAPVTIISLIGSATKTVRVKRLFIGGVSTAVSNSVLKLQRTSALGTGGTSVAPTVALLDLGPSASYAAATAVPAHYTTAAQSSGTTTNMGGPITTRSVGTNVVTTPATAWIEPFAPLFPEAGAPIGSAIVLRGTAQILEVQVVTPANLGAGTVYSYVIEWEEDAS